MFKTYPSLHQSPFEPNIQSIENLISQYESLKTLVIKFCKEAPINVPTNELKSFTVMLGRAYHIIHIILSLYTRSVFNAYAEMEWANGKKETFLKSSTSNFFIKTRPEFPRRR